MICHTKINFRVSEEAIERNVLNKMNDVIIIIVQLIIQDKDENVEKYEIVDSLNSNSNNHVFVRFEKMKKKKCSWCIAIES